MRPQSQSDLRFQEGRTIPCWAARRLPNLEAGGGRAGFLFPLHANSGRTRGSQHSSNRRPTGTRCREHGGRLFTRLAGAEDRCGHRATGSGCRDAFSGIAHAYTDSSPILFLPGHPGRDLVRVPPTFDAVPNFAATTKWADLIPSARSIANRMRGVHAPQNRAAWSGAFGSSGRRRTGNASRAARIQSCAACGIPPDPRQFATPPGCS